MTIRTILETLHLTSSVEEYDKCLEKLKTILHGEQDETDSGSGTFESSAS